MKKKLNALTVSGLMIGPILGSGIIFLPPIAYGILKEHAILAWVLIMALGALFAYVFARMTVMVPTNEGISVIIGQQLGNGFRKLSANYLTMAVLFGPVAVAITVAEYIQPLIPPDVGFSGFVLAFIVMAVSALIVLSGASFMGKTMLVVSSITAVLLLAGSTTTLITAPSVQLPSGLPDVGELGHTMLLIFWAIIGWEVLGNFVEEVSNLTRTIMRAMKLSLVAIVLVYLLTAFALQNSVGATMTGLLEPVFGSLSTVLFSLLVAGLCVCTIVTFTGAVVRQTVSRLQPLRIPALFRKHWPVIVILLLGNTAVLTLHSLGLLSFEHIVGAANALFIGNAFLGLLSGFRLMRSIPIRIGIGVLLLLLLIIFLFSSLYSIGFFVLVTAATLILRKKPDATASAKTLTETGEQQSL